MGNHIDKSCCVRREKDDLVDKRLRSLGQVPDFGAFSKTGLRIETPSNCRSEIDTNSPLSRKSMTMKSKFAHNDGHSHSVSPPHRNTM